MNGRHHTVVKYSKIKVKYWFDSTQTTPRTAPMQGKTVNVATLRFCNQDMMSHPNPLTVSATAVQSQPGQTGWSDRLGLKF